MNIAFFGIGAMGAPMNATPHQVAYCLPTNHLRTETVEETHNMPVPIPAKIP